ncbi:MAG: hypothetical protein BAJALOKI3v1_50006 [Promethearchaeota archaeon]|nr:MAG: hypothetical protein BAJALOKI3v1_50006 [Candidatus Lokiarchaeota archaeon]
MRHLSFSDNCCTVGWTSIHASMSYEDMKDLLSKCPKGRFSNTFFCRTSIYTIEQYAEYLNERCCHGTHNDVPELPFYFTFPLDDDGIRLLRNFGYTPERSRYWHERICIK